jgi:hypothetical protein
MHVRSASRQNDTLRERANHIIANNTPMKPPWLAIPPSHTRSSINGSRATDPVS